MWLVCPGRGYSAAIILGKGVQLTNETLALFKTSRMM